MKSKKHKADPGAFARLADAIIHPEREEGAPLPNGPDGWQQAVILFCNHDATFVADIIVTPIAVVVIAKGKIKLCFGNTQAAQWRIVDDCAGTYWNPEQGRFVLPRNAVTRIKS